MPTAWTYENGCGNCDDDLLDLSHLSVSVRMLTQLQPTWVWQICVMWLIMEMCLCRTRRCRWFTLPCLLSSRRRFWKNFWRGSRLWTTRTRACGSSYTTTYVRLFVPVLFQCHWELLKLELYCELSFLVKLNYCLIRDHAEAMCPLKRSIGVPLFLKRQQHDELLNVNFSALLCPHMCWWNTWPACRHMQSDCAGWSVLFLLV